jgi:ribosomal protein S12
MLDRGARKEKSKVKGQKSQNQKLEVKGRPRGLTIRLFDQEPRQPGTGTRQSAKLSTSHL